MMRYSRALALIVALSLAVSSEGFRLKRKAGDSEDIAEVNFHQWQDVKDTEELSLVQEEAEDFVINVRTCLNKLPVGRCSYIR